MTGRPSNSSLGSLLGGQNVPSITRVAAAAFGFLTLIQLLDGLERYGAVSRFDAMPSSGGRSRPRAFELFHMERRADGSLILAA
jgi:hypothetical protein